MGKTTCLMLVLLLIWSIIKSQNTYNTILKEINSLDSVSWFGLDFSNAKFVGDFPNREYVKNSYLEAWNSIVISNDLLFYYRRTPFIYDLSIVKKRNKGITEDDLFSMLTQSLTKAKIQNIINEYKPEIQTGKGLVLIVEGFDKNLEEASIWFTYFDIKTLNVIYTEKIVGLARGTTMVNHWGQAITDIIKNEPGVIPNKKNPGTEILAGLFIGIMIAVLVIMLK